MLHNAFDLLTGIPTAAAGGTLLLMGKRHPALKRRRWLLLGWLCLAISAPKLSAAFDPPYLWSARTKALAMLAVAVAAFALVTKSKRPAAPPTTKPSAPQADGLSSDHTPADPH